MPDITPCDASDEEKNRVREMLERCGTIVCEDVPKGWKGVADGKLILGIGIHKLHVQTDEDEDEDKTDEYVQIAGPETIDFGKTK